MTTLIQKHQKTLEKLAKENHLSYLALFGSHARGEAKPDSDIDFLIDFNQPKTLFDLANLKISLEDALEKKVDLTFKDKIKKPLQSYINQDLITLYEQN